MILIITVYLEFIHLDYCLNLNLLKHLSDLVCIALGKQQRTLLSKEKSNKTTRDKWLTIPSLIKITYLYHFIVDFRHFLAKRILKNNTRTLYYNRICIFFLFLLFYFFNISPAKKKKQHIFFLLLDMCQVCPFWKIKKKKNKAWLWLNRTIYWQKCGTTANLLV